MIFKFKDNNGSDSLCGVELRKIKHSDVPIAILQDLADYRGPTVVNSFENIATLVYHMYFLAEYGMNDIKWYQRTPGGLELVFLTAELGKYTDPRWIQESTEPITEPF